MKTKEELNALKEEYEALNKKLAELSEEEMKQVAGGGICGENNKVPGWGEEDGSSLSSHGSETSNGAVSTHGPTKR